MLSFDDVPGAVRILRNGESIWEKQIRTGELNMCHSLANLEHHHFKFAAPSPARHGAHPLHGCRLFVLRRRDPPSVR